MKALVAAFLIILNTASVWAMDTEGYLVFSLSRATWQNNNEESASFKVPVNEDFQAQFKHLPSPTSMGTGFYCGGGKADPAPSWVGPTAFTWWVRRTSEGKLSINMWAKGIENINGQHISSHNPSASQYVVFKTWADIDMVYQLTYQAGEADGMNVSFGVKYYPASDKKLEKIPFAPVRKADHGDLITDKINENKNVRFKCGFQEG
jgi:hypothetical protein